MRLLVLALLLGLACDAVAQEVANQEAAPVADDTTTLETVHVTAPAPETLDLYRFRNPVEVPPTTFDRSWHEPKSLEQIGLDGGVLPLIVDYAAMKVRDGMRKTRGWKKPPQAVIARPPPLNEAQAERAIRQQEDSQ